MVAPFTASSVARPAPARRLARTVAILSVVGLALTACGDDDQGPIPASGERETTTTTEATTTTAPSTTTTTNASGATTTGPTTPATVEQTTTTAAP